MSGSANSGSGGGDAAMRRCRQQFFDRRRRHIGAWNSRRPPTRPREFEEQLGGAGVTHQGSERVKGCMCSLWPFRWPGARGLAVSNRLGLSRVLTVATMPPPSRRFPLGCAFPSRKPTNYRPYPDTTAPAARRQNNRDRAPSAINSSTLPVGIADDKLFEHRPVERRG